MVNVKRVLKWIINILINKWDTIKFIELNDALFLARTLKSFIFEPGIVRFYRQNMVFIRDMCRTVKYERPTSNFHLELLSFSDFFNAGNDHYLCFREFVMSYILNLDDIYSVKKFYCEDLFFAS